MFKNERISSGLIDFVFIKILYWKKSNRKEGKFTQNVISNNESHPTKIACYVN